MNIRSFSQLKQDAKNVLSGKYWYSFGVYVILSTASYIISMIASSIMTVPVSGLLSALLASCHSQSAEFLAAVTVLITSAVGVVVMIIASLVILTPLETGLIKFFINETTGTHDMYDLLFVFKNRMGNVVLIGFLKNLYVFLWSLLLIVPGIVKSYEYSMISYIIAENPSLDRKRAFEISKALTDGNKLKIFLFSLSFIGWILLACLTCGIGMMFLAPYMQASFTQLYIDLKSQAIENGSVSAEEFIYIGI
ncbi:MAG: DUF975 family protein [Oscillospiraceae bacterium]|nr:DUF975 family protein [Oscillospiraceae bacterium]